MADDVGKIVTAPKFYNNFVKLGIDKGDTTRYGDQPYTPLRISLPKVKVTSLEPEKGLEEKLKPFIEWYKKWLRMDGLHV